MKQLEVLNLQEGFPGGKFGTFNYLVTNSNNNKIYRDHSRTLISLSQRVFPLFRVIVNQNFSKNLGIAV